MPVGLDVAKLEALEGLLDEVLASGAPADLPGSALAEAQPLLARIRNKHAALDVTVAAAFDASREWMANGSRTAPAWLMTKNRERKGVPQRRVGLGRALRSMPRTEAALAAGEITIEHAEALAELRSGREEVFADGERRLVDKARTSRYIEFVEHLHYWRDKVDPDAADKTAEDKLADRHWHASKSFEDMVRGDGWLDPIGGSIYLKELERLEKWLFEQDWADATARLGEGNVTAADLARTPAQRRADAQVLMAVRSGNQSLGAGSLQLVLNIVMDWATFCAELARWEGRRDVLFPDERTCRLADGTIIAPSQALSLGLAGEVRSLLLGPDGEIMDYGQAERFFPDPLRTAIELVHPRCTHMAGCDVPSWKCEMDHIKAFVDGGRTAGVNGQPHCKPHNRHKETVDRRERIKKRRANAARRRAGLDGDPDAEVP